MPNTPRRKSRSGLRRRNGSGASRLAQTRRRSRNTRGRHRYQTLRHLDPVRLESTRFLLGADPGVLLLALASSTGRPPSGTTKARSTHCLSVSALLCEAAAAGRGQGRPQLSGLCLHLPGHRLAHMRESLLALRERPGATTNQGWTMPMLRPPIA
jgi:hypothetical protein